MLIAPKCFGSIEGRLNQQREKRRYSTVVLNMGQEET